MIVGLPSSLTLEAIPAPLVYHSLSRILHLVGICSCPAPFVALLNTLMTPTLHPHPKNGPSCHVGMRLKCTEGFSGKQNGWLSFAVFGPIVQAVKHRRRYWIHLPEPCSHAYKGWLRGGGLRHRDTTCTVPTRCSKSLPPPTAGRAAAYVGACPLYEEACHGGTVLHRHVGECRRLGRCVICDSLPRSAT